MPVGRSSCRAREPLVIGRPRKVLKNLSSSGRRGPMNRPVVVPVRARTPGALVGIAYMGFAVWFFANDAGPTTRTAVANLAYPLIGLGVAWLAWLAHAHATAPRARRGWALFAAAMAARAAADTCWFWLETVTHQSPYPSIADVGYTASYVLMFVAVWQLGSPRQGLDRRSLALDLATVTTGALILVWYLLLAQITDSSQALVQHALAVGYPVADALLVTAAVALLLRRPAWLSARALVLLTAGLVAWAGADVLWTRLSLGSDYAGGDWIDLVWLGAMVCWGAAAHCARHDVAAPARALPLVRVEQVVPYVGLAMGYFVLLAKVTESQFRSFGVAVVGSLLLGVFLAARQSAVKRDHVTLLARYYDLATIDALTGLLRREALIDEAERALVRAKASNEIVSILMIDVDRFKLVNDEYGHAAGDAVLMTVSQLCRDLRRGNDVMGRFGGDELVALLPGVDQEGALTVARRLIETVASRPTMIHGAALPVTLSIGAADSGGDEPLIALMARADDALYRAKAAGRGVAVGYRCPLPPGEMTDEDRVGPHRSSGPARPGTGPGVS
jgi:diguanylate cyclase (GGDEF)-like protein